MPCHLPRCGLISDVYPPMQTMRTMSQFMKVMEDLAGSSATKKARARKILKSPSKKVSLDVLATFR